MKKAALFFDIDGTILSEKTKEIPKSAIETLLAAQKKGHLLFINTGRTMCSIPAQLKQFMFDGYLCGCGTYLTYHDEETPAQCRKVKEVGDLMTGEPATEAPVNGANSIDG